MNDQPQNQIAVMKSMVAKMQPEFAKALPSYIPAERFVRTVQTALAHTRNIEKVTDRNSLLSAVTKAAADGLILDGREAALVVDFKGEVQYRPMMRGLLKLAYNSGHIKSLVVETARQNDVFDYSPTRAADPIRHEINLREDRGEVFAYYAIAELKDGGVVFEVMTVADVHRIRNRSDAYKAFAAGKIKSTPWSTDEVEMGRKTVFRRLSKYLPSSTDRDALHQAAERIDEDFGFEAEATEPATPAAAQPVRKERGGAAARLKDITPTATVEPETVEHDAETGEIYDPSDEDIQPGDDI